MIRWETYQTWLINTSNQVTTHILNENLTRNAWSWMTYVAQHTLSSSYEVLSNVTGFLQSYSTEVENRPVLWNVINNALIELVDGNVAVDTPFNSSKGIELTDVAKVESIELEIDEENIQISSQLKENLYAVRL